MASISVINYTNGGNMERTTLQGVQLSERIGVLKHQVFSSLSNSGANFELVYRGRILSDECSLDSYGIKTGCTLSAIERRPADVDAATTECMEDDGIDTVTQNQFAEALIFFADNTPYRAIAEEVLAERRTIDGIIETTAGLKADIVAQAVLREPDMLTLLASPSYASKLLAAHPCLARAVVQIGVVAKERAAARGLPPLATMLGAQQRGNHGLSGRSTRRQHDDGNRPTVLPMPTGGSAAIGVITNSQLSAALAAATASASPQMESPAVPSLRLPTAGAGSAAPTNQSAAPISGGFFAQALQQARELVQSSSLAAGSPSGGVTAPVGSTRSSRRVGGAPSARALDSQIQQLRDMGISDEETARRALLAAHGNVALALELIYGDGDILN